MTAHDPAVPKGLRTWFVIHFFADMLFAIPLLVAPAAILARFGWQTVDPFTARLVGAALMGIGLESLLGRNAGAESFRSMLQLKIIWASSAVLGIALSLLVDGAPPAGWAFLVIFVVFDIVWITYRLRLK